VIATYCEIAPEEVWSILPLFPSGYRVLERGPDGGSWRSFNGLQVIASVCREADGKRWIHVSFSRPKRLPDWNDIKMVKRDFIGPDRVAIQVLPRESEYYNAHPYCLHLWSCMDGDPVPDFRKEGHI